MNAESPALAWRMGAGFAAIAERSLIRDVTLLVLAVICIGRAAGLLEWTAIDFHAYWSLDLRDPYQHARQYVIDAFLYSPAFAQVVQPLTWLPYNLALGLWTALELGCLYWLAGRWTLVLAVPLAAEWMNGQIHLVMAAGVVLGMTRPVGWLAPAFTKLSPAVGLGWFAFRGEWRYFARAAAMLAIVAGVSFLLAPALWFQWFDVLRANIGVPAQEGSAQLAVPLLVRLPVAVALLAFAARTNRRWLVPIACALALPVLWISGFFAFAIAAWRLLCDPVDPDRARGDVAGWPRTNRGVVLGQLDRDHRARLVGEDG